MALASLGSLGGTSAKAAGATLAFSPSQGIAAGNLVVVWAGWASDYFFGPDDRQNAQLKIGDDAGNVYCSPWCWYPAGGTPNLAALYLCLLEHAITTGTVITLTHRNNTLVPKACSAWAFSTSGPTFRWAVVNGQLAGGGSSGIDPPAVTISALPSQEYLLLHSFTAEAPSTDAYTWDADYTRIDTFGTTGGAASSNITALGGWRIATLTTDTVDIQSDTADRAYDQALGALCEVAYNPLFPSTPTLDNFHRADVEPLPSPPWDTTASQPQFGSAQIRNVSDLAARGLAGAGGGSQWYDTTFTGSKAEVWAHLRTTGGCTLTLHGTGSASSATIAGYGLAHQLDTVAFVDEFMSFGGGSDTGIYQGGADPAIWGDLPDFSQLGLQFDNPVLHAWVGYGGVMQWRAGFYITGSLLVTTGRLGLAFAGDTVSRVSEFGGGLTTTPTTNVKLPYLHVGP
jgi:hypothetical protein